MYNKSLLYNEKRPIAIGLLLPNVIFLSTQIFSIYNDYIFDFLSSVGSYK